MKRHRELFFAALVVVLAPAAAARADLAFNFNSGNDTGLTRYDPLAPFGSGSTYTFPVLGPGNDGYRLTTGPSANPAALGPARVVSYSSSQVFSNFRESVDVLGYDSNNQQALGLLARGNNVGLGTSNAYFLQYNTTATAAGQAELIISRLDGEFPVITSTAVDFSKIDPAVGLRLVFTGAGSTLTGQVFALSNLNQSLATVTLVDSTYSSGFSGLVAGGIVGGTNLGAAATFDNFSVQAVPEPSVVALAAVGLCGLGLTSVVRSRRTSRNAHDSGRGSRTAPV